MEKQYIQKDFYQPGDWVIGPTGNRLDIYSDNVLIQVIEQKTGSIYDNFITAELIGFPVRRYINHYLQGLGYSSRYRWSDIFSSNISFNYPTIYVKGSHLATKQEIKDGLEKMKRHFILRYGQIKGRLLMKRVFRGKLPKKL